VRILLLLKSLAIEKGFFKFSSITIFFFLKILLTGGILLLGVVLMITEAVLLGAYFGSISFE